MSTEDQSAVPENVTGLDSFFAKQALFGKYRLPVLIALFTGFVWAIQPVAIYYTLEVNTRENIKNAVAVDWMVHFIIPLVFWVVFSALFVLVSYYVVSARMRVGRMFKLTGWGLFPFALIGLVRAAAKYFVFENAEIPTGVIMGRFPSEWDGYQALTTAHAGDTLLVAANIGSCVFLLLSAYIWTYSIKNSTDLEEYRDILIIVSVPTLLYLVYTIFTNVTAL